MNFYYKKCRLELIKTESASIKFELSVNENDIINIPKTDEDVMKSVEHFDNRAAFLVLVTDDPIEEHSDFLYENKYFGIYGAPYSKISYGRRFEIVENIDLKKCENIIAYETNINPSVFKHIINGEWNVGDTIYIVQAMVEPIPTYKEDDIVYEKPRLITVKDSNGFVLIEKNVEQLYTHKEVEKLFNDFFAKTLYDDKDINIVPERFSQFFQLNKKE